MNQQFFLQVMAKGLAITVSINDVPVIVESQGVGFQETLPVNIWLKGRDNSLSVKLDKVDDDAEADVVKEAQVILFAHAQGNDTPTVGRILAELRWPSTNEKPVYPKQWQQIIAEPIALPPGLILWQKTQAIHQVDGSSRQLMYTAICHLAELLRQRKLNEAYEYMQLKYQEDAISEGKAVQQIKSAVMELWQDMVGNPTVQLLSLSIDELEFAIVAEQHLVQVSRREGMPAILFEDADAEMLFGIPLYFANIGGRWLILR